MPKNEVQTRRQTNWRGVRGREGRKDREGGGEILKILLEGLLLAIPVTGPPPPFLNLSICSRFPVP